MHELVFSRQDRLDDAALRTYAEELGVDGRRVTGDAAQVFGDKVEADFAAGLEAGVGGTPTGFVDGRVYAGGGGAGGPRRAIGGGESTRSGAPGRRAPGG